ncbi:iron-siderophore ABC transporter substrate-binding protein [Lolliginicoccus suaedae]|uniref:iron-siderophore ABC transporter substrate-binding protein n=1 Tax=Lolliginicoccus suaedae TaxID=2605429 RepID=UPI0011ED19E5|nr:iron-siderophore ABC transporter substrate-binding protein [Lolliginicoccus suaedae]
MRTNRLIGLAASAAATVALVGCGASSDTPGTTANPGDADAFPMTIEHALGTTTIESLPERIATVQWSNHEVPLALGVVPVGMAEASWGDDDGDGVLPWVEDRLSELGAETPVLFDEADGIDFEAVADTAPDVILASYSGLTEEDYATLSKIAPVVAYPEVAWGTSYQDMITLNSKAIGLEDEGEQLNADLRAEVEETLAKYPEIEGKTIAFSYIDPTDLSEVGFYTTQDTRPGFLKELGFPTPAVVEELSATSETFYEAISSEEVDRMNDIDILVTYGDEDTLAALQADPLLSKVRAIARGSVVILEDSTPLASSANPSPLSIGWGIDEYFALFAEAAAKVE